jgi:hypothetical protein
MLGGALISAWVVTSRQRGIPRRRLVVSFSHVFPLSLFCVRLLRRIMYYLVVTFRVTVVESTHVVWSTGGMAVVGLVHGFSMVEERTANALCTSTLGDAFVLI